MPSTASAEQLRAEFDEIAALTPSGSAVTASERWILDNLPGPRSAVLDIGCGVGELTQHLANRFDLTTGIDLSTGMIEEAKRRSRSANHVTFACADMFDWLEERRDAYDCIVSVAALHHVDFERALHAMADALRPGGRFLVIDLFDRPGIRHLATNALAFAAGAARDVVALAARRSSVSVMKAYRRHGENETYLTLPVVKTIARRTLPRVSVRGTLLWRYRLLWDKP